MERAPDDAALWAAIAWGLRHDAFLQAHSRVALEMWAAGAKTDLTRDVIWDAVARTRTQIALGERPPLRTPLVSLGEGLPGVRTFDGEPLSIGVPWLAAGVQLLARSGGGKSTLLGHWAPGAAAAGVCVVLVECAKREHRRLLRVCRRLGVPCVVLRAEDLRLNLLDRQGLPVAKFAPAIADVLGYALDLRPLGRVVTRQLLEAEYARRPPTAPPTLGELAAAWVGATERNALMRESAAERFTTLLADLPTGVRDVRRGWWLEALCAPGQVVVLELDGLSVAAQQWIVLGLVAALHLRGVERAGA